MFFQIFHLLFIIVICRIESFNFWLGSHQFLEDAFAAPQPWPVGRFKYFLCSPLLGEMIQFDWYFFKKNCWNHQLDDKIRSQKSWTSDYMYSQSHVPRVRWCWWIPGLRHTNHTQLGNGGWHLLGFCDSIGAHCEGGPSVFMIWILLTQKRRRFCSRWLKYRKFNSERIVELSLRLLR